MVKNNSKPRIFIASSEKNINIANAVQVNLSNYKNSRLAVWNQGTFGPSEYFLQSILKELEKVDFGIFIFAADDLILRKDTKIKTVRDNVLFELGMFVAKLGKERNFIIMPNDKGIEIASDLQGINILTYTEYEEDEIYQALGPACDKINKEIVSIGVTTDHRKTTDEKQDLNFGEIYKNFIGIQKHQKCLILSHCDDPEKYTLIGERAPGATIMHELNKSNINASIELKVINNDKKPSLNNYKNISTFFIIDSPYYNPNTKFIIDNYKTFLIGGNITNLIQPNNRVIQVVCIGSKSFYSDKKNGMNSLDYFNDYLVIMRLPGIFPGKNLSFPELFKEKTMWVIYGIHTKATHAGANFFSKTNLELFVRDLPKELSGILPGYFEAVFKIPKSKIKIEKLKEFQLIHFNTLRIKSEVALEDELPPGVFKYFSDEYPDYLKSDIPIHTIHLDPICGCNFKCPSCIEKLLRSKNLCLSMKKITKILCDLKSVNCKNLNFYGGEPTLHPDFPLLLELGDKLDFRMLLVTNGSLLGEKEIKESIINSQNLHIRVSIDSNSNKTYSKIHGLDESNNYFDKVIENIQSLLRTKNTNSNNITISITFLLHKDTIQELTKACEFWRKVGSITSLHLRPITKIHGVKPLLDYSNEERKLLEGILDKYQGWVITPNWFYNYINKGYKPETIKKYDKCYSGYYRFVISPLKLNNNKNKIKNHFGLNLKYTDDAWISLCPYYRLDHNYGCLYPENLKEWSKSNRIQKLEEIKPNQNCNSIICCRNESNLVVSNAI